MLRDSVLFMKKDNQKQIPSHLLDEIKDALKSVKFGSIEIFVQNRIVTQITVRNIHKTSMELEKEDTKVSLKSHIQKSSVGTSS